MTMHQFGDARSDARSDFKPFLRRFGSSERGNIAMLFALMLVPIMAFTGGAIDYTRYNSVRANLIESLDAAGLAIAQIDAINGPDIRNLSGEAREEYLKNYGQAVFFENFKYEGLVNDLQVDFEMDNLTVTPEATGKIRTLILSTLGPLMNMSTNSFAELNMSSDTEITRAAVGNTEVSLVLDITGSMSGTRIDDLKAAADEFVDVLVRDDQSEYYSKVAIIPYSMAVNVGASAAAARGAPIAPVSITGATRQRPVVITAPGHTFSDGDRIYITGVNGMWELNNKAFQVDDPSGDTFELRTLGGSNVDGRNWNSYTSGGNVDCTDTGCRYKLFVNAQGNWRVHPLSNCVSERSGAEAETDAATTSNPVGWVYDATGNPCPSLEIVPLTNNKTTLHDAIDDLPAAGSTAGHLGIAWGWYAVSPNFTNIFTGDSAPGAYDDNEIAKSVVLMTDGDFNTVYCQGVISQSSGSGSGSSADKINCNAPEGDSIDQAKAYCDAMKDEGITIYTVGFDIGSLAGAQEVMADCASSENHAYSADDGDALKRVFADIAQAIAQLHVSR
ncbi:MAG: hypothetical protein GC152_05975 [Alphaproteobacteria bacterium]|nr:hypothetical protein [Alphaproteobacteria bacterium]